MSVTTGDVVVQVFTTTNPSTGAAADADSLPTGVLWVDGVTNAAIVTIADAAGTGRYTFSVTMPTLTAGVRVQVVVDATIGGVACAGSVWEDQARSSETGVLPGEGMTYEDLIEDIDVQLSSTHGADAWGEGVGASSVVYTVYAPDGVTPDPGVAVRMTSDAAGLSNIDHQITNASGQVTLHHDLAHGTTVYLWRYKAGRNYSDPDVEVIP